jgi:hypothetical protein
MWVYIPADDEPTRLLIRCSTVAPYVPLSLLLSTLCHPGAGGPVQTLAEQTDASDKTNGSIVAQISPVTSDSLLLSTLCHLEAGRPLHALIEASFSVYRVQMKIVWFLNKEDMPLETSCELLHNSTRIQRIRS